MVESIAASLREREPGRTVEVVTDGEAYVDADAPLLRIVLENLLGNAWKFTRRTPHARIEVAMDDGALVVRDNGVGFDPTHADRLFGAFQRLHKASDFEGSGVGLATVRRVMNKHGGTVTAVAAVGKGATFRLTFPPRQRTGDSMETDGGIE
jgi:signal transduction histidine kinase